MKKEALMHLGHTIFLILLQVVGTYVLVVCLDTDWIVIKASAILFFNWVIFILLGQYVMKNYSTILQRYYKLNSRYELVSILYDLLKELADIEDHKEVYDAILQAAIKSVPTANRGTVMIRKDDKVVFEAAVGFDMTYLDLIELKAEETALYIGTNGKMDHAVITKDVIRNTASRLSDSTVDLFIKAGAEPVRSSLAVPILINKKAVGSINLDSDMVDSFTKQDSQVIEIFSYEVSRIVQLYQVLEENVQMSRFDDLTQIYNRGYCSKILKEKIDSHKSFFLVSVDLNNLKITNDRFGHDVGDEIIKYFVNNFKLFIDERVVFSRFGGDEFVLLCQGYTEVEVSVLMHDVTNFFNNHGIDVQEQVVHVSFSYGMVEFPSESTNYDQLLKIADERMYKYKKSMKQ